MLTYLRLGGIFVMLAVTIQVKAKDETKDCVEALRIAARDEYKLEDDKALDTAFNDAFCEAVKDKRASKSKQDGSAMYEAFFASLSNDQSSLAEFERNYCRATSSKLNFKSAVRMWASVVHGDPLQQFNVCMDKAMRAIASRGVFSDVNSADACHSVVGLAYRPTGEGPRSAKVNSVHAYNVQCSRVPPVLRANVQNFECRRTSWGPGTLSIGTSQEPIEISFPGVKPPEAPAAPAISSSDTKTKTIVVKPAAYEEGVKCVNDGRLCDGPISLGAGAKAIAVKYSCVGPNNQNGHNLCGWSYGNRGGGSYEANWNEVGDGELRWYRYWDGDASRAIVETYTVTFTAPHSPTDAEKKVLADYEAQLAKHQAQLASGPCPLGSANAQQSPGKAKK